MAAYYDPQGVLFGWKGGRASRCPKKPDAVWTLTHATSGVLTTGSIGSGKTSAVAALLASSFLTSTESLPGGMGGLALFAKNGECDEFVRLCKLARRADDILRITTNGPHRFNFMDWIASWGEGGERGPIPAVALLMEIASVLRSEGKGGENAFFENAFRTRLTNLVHIIQLAGLPLSLPLLRAIAVSGPLTLEQVKDETWRTGSVCWAILKEAYEATRDDIEARRDWRECRNHFLSDYPALSSRTRGGIDTMVTDLVRPFVTRPLRPLFCGATTYRPEDCFAGKILLLDIPVQEYGVTARLCAMALKRCFQLAVMRRSGPPGSLRPVFWFADEAQNFLSPLDADYQAVARSAGGVTCLLTQQVSSIRQALGSQDLAENLTSNIGTKIFCNNNGESATYASNLISGRFTQINSLSINQNAPTHPDEADRGGKGTGISRAEQWRPWVETGVFQRLKRGGNANNREVEAVVVVAGESFPGPDGKPQPYQLVTFTQEAR